MSVGGKVNPLRQAMINMMYLVLVALLALNVSAEVLRAFKLVNDGLEDTTLKFDAKNAIIYTSFQAQYAKDSAKVGPYYNAAVNAKTEADKLIAYIDSLKAFLLAEGDGFNEYGRIVKESDLDIGSEHLITKGEGKKLKDKINATRTYFYNLIPADKRKDVSLSLEAVDPKPGAEGLTQTWEQQLFEDVPLSAVYTLMSKLQNDVRNSEGEVVNFLFKQITAADHKFDQLIPIIKTNKNLFSINEEIKAEIVLGAYSSTQTPQITLNGANVEVRNGVGYFTTRASKEGPITLKGNIKVENPDGTDTSYSFTTDVQGFKGAAVISADAMNVLYIGLENPISISVPGFPPDQIRASISNGTLKGSNGKYTAEVRAGTERKATITASVTVEGQTRVMGSQEYRIRQVPKPVAYFGNKTQGEVSGGELQAVNFIVARMGEGFAFEGINYKVSKFTFMYVPRQAPLQTAIGSGASFTPQMSNWKNGAKSGDQIIITSIRAIGPGGVGEVPLEGAIVLTVR